MINFLCIIQARLTSTRFPGKVLQTVGGIPIVRRVWLAAKDSKVDKVVAAWPERFPDLDENNVLERFRRISKEFPSKYIVRLTADCPLITADIINEALEAFIDYGSVYYCNRFKYPDGFDVQVFTSFMLHRGYATHKEHVIKPEKYPTRNKYLSVDRPMDLIKVREYLNGK